MPCPECTALREELTALKGLVKQREDEMVSVHDNVRELEQTIHALMVALGDDLLNAQFPESTDWPAVAKRITDVLASPEVAAWKAKQGCLWVYQRYDRIIRHR